MTVAHRIFGRLSHMVRHRTLKSAADFHYKLASSIGADSPNEWIRKSSKIDGWLFPGEPEHLFKLAKESPLGNVLEIGTWCGKSACLFAGACQDRKDGSFVICVDTFLMDGTAGQIALHQKIHNEYGTFYNLVRQAKVNGYYERIIPVAQYSTRAVPILNTPLRLAFLDGRHDRSGVLEDLALVVDSIVPGGFIVLHDSDENWPDVEPAAEEFLGKRVDFKKVGKVGSCLTFQRAG